MAVLLVPLTDQTQIYLLNTPPAAHPGWKILIVDEPGMKVISSAVGMYDIMERQISIVESLDKRRAPFKDMAAVYILAPTKDSVRKLIADYEDKTKVLYGKSVFVYFLGPMPNNLIEEIKACKQLIKRLKALSEINVDFLIQEPRAFTLDVDAPFGSYYLRSSGASSAEKKVADKLVTVCATLNEYPYIRYKQSSGVCSGLAAIFKVKMDDYVKSNPSWWYHGSGKCHIRNGERDRSTLLLLDRASDCLTPLMHDFTYQAMVHDLLTMEGDKITYQAEKADNPSQKEDKDVLLNEKDNVWVEMRGNHIAQVIEVLSGRINEVVNSSTTRVHKGSSSNMSISELASALKDLPEYREVMSKLSQHLHIAHDCMDKFNRAGLLDLADIEQTLATGKDEDGRSPKLTETISRCESALIRLQDPDDRLRLILIATISQNGLSSADRDRLLRAAQLGRSQLQTLESLNRIGINTVTNDFATPTSASNSFFGYVPLVLRCQGCVMGLVSCLLTHFVHLRLFI
jgi:syntaxin-binding protein 1